MTELRRRRDDGWHIGKTIDISHMITTLGLVIGGLWFLAGLDKRIALLENGAVLQQEIREDLKEIKQTVAPLPEFIKRKDRTDDDQNRRIRELETQ